jgi:Family of unknown function (DUF6455)
MIFSENRYPLFGIMLMERKAPAPSKPDGLGRMTTPAAEAVCFRNRGHNSAVDERRGKPMWTLYGLAEIGALTGNVVRRWHSRWTVADSDDETAEAGLLARRMAAVGVDADTFARLEPALFANLKTMCRECDRPGQCRHELRRDPSGAAWEEYCPNATVLNAVAELRWFRTANKRR